MPTINHRRTGVAVTVGLMQRDCHTSPNTSQLSMQRCVFTVRGIEKGKALYDLPSFEQARLGVFKGPVTPEVLYDLKCLAHEPVSPFQIPFAHRLSLGVVRATRARPDKIIVVTWVDCVVPGQKVSNMGGRKPGFNIDTSHLNRVMPCWWGTGAEKAWVSNIYLDMSE